MLLVTLTKDSFMQDINGDIVTQGNELIEASYKMTLNEKRVLLLGIAKINPMRRSGEGLNFFITVDDWHSAYPDDPNPWRSMQRGAKGLFKRYVTFRGSADEVTDLSWLDKSVYQAGHGVVRVEFGRNISKYLTGNLDRFTAIPLLMLGQFHSIHTIRLYELLKQYKFTGFLKISIDDFRFSMACKYPRMNTLKQRVLDPALKEINEKTDLKVAFKQLKSGHRGGAVTHFVFTFAPEKRKKSRVTYDNPPDKPTNGSTSTRARSLRDDMEDRTWAE